MAIGKYCSPAAFVLVTAISGATTSANHALESESDSESESLYEVDGGSSERGTKSIDTKRVRRYGEIELLIKLRKFVTIFQQRAYIFFLLHWCVALVISGWCPTGSLLDDPGGENRHN